MPQIQVRIPAGVLSSAQKQALAQQLTEVAAAVEQIPADAEKRLLCWVLFDEVAAGCWTCGGHDLTERFVPCVVHVSLPAGVVDAALRRDYVRLVHDAVERVVSQGVSRPIATSIRLHEVPDGTWGVNGALWGLPDFVRSAGFRHLQHLLAV